MAIQPQRKLSYEDYARFPDDGRRWEVIDGEAFLVPSPDTEHQDVAGRLYRRIAEHLDAHGGGRVFISPLDVIFSDHDILQPDVIFVADEHASVITDKNIRGTPTWLVEIVSDPVRDLRVKRDTYLRFGVQEYWALEPELRRLEVFVPGAEPLRYEAPATVPSGVLPGLDIDLEDVLGPDRRPRRH
ncbi:MAG: Uma2 family endonuclease [Actinomycetota bacterium]